MIHAERLVPIIKTTIQLIKDKNAERKSVAHLQIERKFAIAFVCCFLNILGFSFQSRLDKAEAECVTVSFKEDQNAKTLIW